MSQEGKRLLSGWLEGRRWLVWGVEEGNPKRPYGRGLTPASTTDPDTWLELAEAEALVAEGVARGVGRVLVAEEPWVVLDLDDAIDERGELRPWAGALLAGLETYAERSPSGRGVHAVLRIRGGGILQNRKLAVVGGGPGARIEILRERRYATVTWDPLPGHARPPRSFGAETIWRIVAPFAEPRGDPGGPAARENAPGAAISVPDDPQVERLVARALRRVPKLRGWLEHQAGRLAPRDKSSSGWDWAIAWRAARAGLSDEEIAALIIEHRRRLAGRQPAEAARILAKARRPDYLARTVAAARASAGEPRPPEPEPAVADEAEVHEGDPARALELIASTLRIERLRAVEVSLDAELAERWRLLDDQGGEVTVGTSEDWLRFRRVATAAATLGGWLDPVDGWQAAVGQHLLRAAWVASGRSPADLARERRERSLDLLAYVLRGAKVYTGSPPYGREVAVDGEGRLVLDLEVLTSRSTPGRMLTLGAWRRILEELGAETRPLGYGGAPRWLLPPQASAELARRAELELPQPERAGEPEGSA